MSLASQHYATYIEFTPDVLFAGFLRINIVEGMMSNLPHGIYNEEFSDSFLYQVAKLRRMDSMSVSHPLYREKMTALFTAITERFMPAMLANIEVRELRNITLEQALVHYLDKDAKGNPTVQHIIQCVEPFCEQMYISVEVYGVSVFSFVFCTASGNDRAAFAYFSLLMRPLVSAYRLREAAIRQGKKGGRPPHRHKSEALDIARKFRLEVKTPSLYRIVQVVAGELAKKYTDAPSARAIENWLKQLYYQHNNHHTISTQKPGF